MSAGRGRVFIGAGAADEKKRRKKAKRAGTYRVTRGGSWNSGPDCCRSAARRPEPPAAGTNVVGFRVVVDAP
jgi:formylglycine-generating enzyme required for sulfatase activity